ncbi:hypothetical protein LWI28_012709 [Acer negundo]|uniref:C-JID domain-containing protein n=1 Tax=Acer negundo TaxID=4023 RepID=A0AAD5IAI5_ACENE|nr:hypothetical protein LWI28_012709 [Acer negundo]
MLLDNKGTHEVEGIMLNKSKRQIPHLDGKSFSSMSKLRLLKISNVDHSKDLIYLSNELRFLKWDGYPSNSLPPTFQARKLFELNLCHSKIKYLWKGMKTFEKLKKIKLSYSHNLIETPDFTSVPNLEKLNLEENQDRENSLAVMLLKLHLREFSFKSVGFHICLPGSEIPAAFKHWSTEGSKIEFGLSPNWYTDEFMGIALCAVLPELSRELYGLCKCRISCIISIGSRLMTYLITIPSHVHSDHLWLGYLSIREMIGTQYSDPNDLRCIHVRVILIRYYQDPDPLNSVADNRSPICLPAKRCGIRTVYESELENFEEFPAGSNIFQHNHGDVCDAPDIRTLVLTSDLSSPRIINCENDEARLLAPSGAEWHVWDQIKEAMQFDA